MCLYSGNNLLLHPSPVKKSSLPSQLNWAGMSHPGIEPKPPPPCAAVFDTSIVHILFGYTELSGLGDLQKEEEDFVNLPLVLFLP